RKAGDSVGGVVEVRVEGIPAGWGDPVFMKLDAMLGAALMSIGAVKGVEIGDGFALTRRRGSETNDAMAPEGFLTNHMGGILGGITNGEPLIVRAAVKPTSSIRHEQDTVDQAGTPRKIVVRGRHDPCICIRVVPVAEAMVALVLCDAYLRQQAIEEASRDPGQLGAELAFCDAEILRWIHRRRSLAGGPRVAEIQNDIEKSRMAVGAASGLPDSFLSRLFAVVDDAPPPDETTAGPTAGTAEAGQP
ncbi:MAG: chorismate synthase, partial [Gemmatimonadota bacterium]|nr:chorismate synthase [Gemmatimonadota bacterium]